MRQLIWVLLLGSCIAPRQAPMIPVPDEILPHFGLEGKAAGTKCGINNEPYIMVRGSLINNNPVMFLILEHEQEHVRQLQGNCWRVLSRYMKDVAFQGEMENAAHCASIRMARKLHIFDVARLRERYDSLLRASYGRGFKCS